MPIHVPACLTGSRRSANPHRRRRSLVLGTEQRVLGEVDDGQGCKVVYRWILRLMLG